MTNPDRQLQFDYCRADMIATTKLLNHFSKMTDSIERWIRLLTRLDKLRSRRYWRQRLGR